MSGKSIGDIKRSHQIELRIFRYILVAAVLFMISGVTMRSNALCDVYRNEADTFLAAMPENLQARQAEAIREAIGGNCGMLETIRRSRNTPPLLPSGVTRRAVGDNMTLFRSLRHENDIIPLLVYYHGGGWTIGSINSCTRFCSAMALKGIAVLAVDYRLAPENPFPAGLDDCISAAKIGADSLDLWKCSGIVLGGDSSGGNLAISTVLSFPPDTFDGLAVFYPVTKAYADNSPGWQVYGHGFGLDSDLMEAFNAAYTYDIYNPLVSPAMASDDDLKNLPPTLIVSAERDILKDQGREFANRLSLLGNAVTYDMIPGAVHLFITVDGQTSAFNYAVSAASEFISDILTR